MIPGITPIRSLSREWDETGVRLNVFVAGVIAAGALMSIVVGLTESIASRRGREHLARRAAPVAEMMVEGVVVGYDAATRSAVGLRSRRQYLAIAIALLAIAALPVIAGFDDLLSDDSGAVIVSALALSAALTLLVVAGGFGLAVARYPDVPALVRQFAPARPRRRWSVWATVPTLGQRVVYVLLGCFVLLGVLVVVAEGLLLRIDEPLYFDLIEASGGVDRWTPEWVNLLGQAEWAIPIAIVIGLLILRNGFVAIAYPSVVVIGGVTTLFTRWVTHRLRPPEGGHAGEFTSFPGGHTTQLTLLLGMLPLVAFVLTGRKWVAALVGVVAGAIWVVAWGDVLRTGGHWPTDHLGGFLLAIALLIVVYGAASGSQRRAP